jgi:hypothetical protein
MPSLDAIWGPVMDEEVRHSMKTTADGHLVDKMSDAESAALRTCIRGYTPEFASLKMRVLSIFCIHDGHDFLSHEWMTPAQQSQVVEYFENTTKPYTRKRIAEFRSMLPHGRVVEIPNGNHYCFIQQEQLVVDEMRMFLEA